MKGWDTALQIFHHSTELHNAWAMEFPGVLFWGKKKNRKRKERKKKSDLAAKPPKKQEVSHLLLRKEGGQMLGVVNKEMVRS